jgi:hypothetical protein
MTEEVMEGALCLHMQLRVNISGRLSNKLSTTQSTAVVWASWQDTSAPWWRCMAGMNTVCTLLHFYLMPPAVATFLVGSTFVLGQTQLCLQSVVAVGMNEAHLTALVDHTRGLTNDPLTTMTGATAGMLEGA